MGTATLGSTSNPGTTHFFYEGSSSTQRFKANASLSTPVDLYIDSVHIWCGCHNGGSAVMTMAVYGTGGSLLGTTDVNHTWGTGYGFNHSEFSAGNFLHLTSGQNIEAAVESTGQGLQMAGGGSGTGSFSRATGSFPSTWSGTTESSEGNLYWYLTYFPAATITSIPGTPQFPGATIDVFGTSFSAGVTAVKVNSLACSSINVISDTHLTCVLPSNATTGPVEVDTYAGNATSGSDLVVSGGRVYHSGVLVPTTSARIYHGGSLVALTSIRLEHSGSLIDVH